MFVNDCLPVILSLRKGSNSARLQTDSETVALGVLEAGAKASFLHIPGTEMIAARTDGASRDGAKQVIGPALMPAGRDKINSFLHHHGWKVTIDLFAADCNKFCERYASWTDEPNSEAVDAFSIPSWNQSLCGRVHRETAFIFPPKKLGKAIFRRARSDGIRAVFVVPTAYTAGYWMGLRARSTAQLELSSPEKEFYNPQGTMGNHSTRRQQLSNKEVGIRGDSTRSWDRRSTRGLPGPDEARGPSATSSLRVTWAAPLAGQASDLEYSDPIAADAQAPSSSRGGH